MKGYFRAFATALALIVLALTFAVVPAKHASASQTTAVTQATIPWTVAMPSHLGVNPSQFVVLNGTVGGTSWTRINSDGTPTFNFTLRSGQVLVVTEIGYQLFGGTAGGAVGLGLTTAGGGPNIWESPEVTLDSLGDGAGFDHFTSGLVLTALPDPFFTPTSAPHSGQSAEVFLYGYVTTNQ